VKEPEILREIDHIVGIADGIQSALTQIQALLARYCGEALLIIRPAEPGPVLPGTSAAFEFLESREFPFRGLYMAPLRAGNRNAGTLIICIGTWGVPGDLPRRITNYLGQRLSTLASSSMEYAEAA